MLSLFHDMLSFISGMFVLLLILKLIVRLREGGQEMAHLLCLVMRCGRGQWEVMVDCLA